MLDSNTEVTGADINTATARGDIDEYHQGISSQGPPAASRLWRGDSLPAIDFRSLSFNNLFQRQRSGGSAIMEPFARPIRTASTERLQQCPDNVSEAATDATGASEAFNSRLVSLFRGSYTEGSSKPATTADRSAGVLGSGARKRQQAPLRAAPLKNNSWDRNGDGHRFWSTGNGGDGFSCTAAESARALSFTSHKKHGGGIVRPLPPPPQALVAESHACITVFFSDIVGFSTWASKLPPERQANQSLMSRRYICQLEPFVHFGLCCTHQLKYTLVTVCQHHFAHLIR